MTISLRPPPPTPKWKAIRNTEFFIFWPHVHLIPMLIDLHVFPFLRIVQLFEWSLRMGCEEVKFYTDQNKKTMATKKEVYKERFESILGPP